MVLFFSSVSPSGSCDAAVALTAWKLASAWGPSMLLGSEWELIEVRVNGVISLGLNAMELTTVGAEAGRTELLLLLLPYDDMMALMG